MMRLFHNPVSSCSQKVRMVLHEKNLSFDSEVLDLQRGDQFNEDYVKLNPNAVVPTIEDDGRIIIESTLINEYLDDAYPGIDLRPSNAAERFNMRLFCKKIDDALHPACGALTYAIGARPAVLRKSAEERETLINQIPNATRREARRSVIERGVYAPEVKSAFNVHREVFSLADNLLANNAWLSGNDFSLADCALLPYVLRVDHLMMTDEITSRDNLARWYGAIKERQSYQKAVLDWLPEAVVSAFRKAGEQAAGDLKQALAK